MSHPVRAKLVYQALVVILAGQILYAFLNARRERLGETEEPVELPVEPATEVAALILPESA